MDAPTRHSRTVSRDGRNRERLQASAAYERLRELITSGIYTPGMRLRQEELSVELGVGRTPLREALRMLEAEGIVTSSPHRGVTVAVPRLDDIEGIYAARVLMEPALSSAVVEQITESDIGVMEQHLSEMEMLGNRIRDFQKKHSCFHRIVVRYYGSSLSNLVFETFFSRIRWFQHVHLSRPGAVEDFITCDRCLLEAFRNRDRDGVRHILEFHLIDAAIGTVCDVDPDHRWTTLLAACQGAGISIDVAKDGRIVRPAAISWSCGQGITETLRTSNLHVGAARHGLHQSE